MRLSAIALLLAAASPAVAESPRYAFVPAENGVFRLDSATGEVALCTARSGTLICLTSPRPQPQDAAAPPDAASAELEVRVAALEARPRTPAAHAESEAIGRVKVLAERMVGRVVTLVKRMKGGAEESGSL